MTHEPLHPPGTFQELPSSGLESLPESNTPTRPDRGEGHLLFAEWVRGMQPGPWLEASPVFCFLFFFLGTQSFEWAGDSGCPWEAGTGQVCSQGAHGLASRDPCPPMCSPAPWSVSLQTEWCGDPRRVTLFL